MKLQIQKGILIASIALCQIAFAQIEQKQVVYTIQKNDDIDMKLKGTSTMHDWEMDAISATGKALFFFKTNTKENLSALHTLTFTLLVKDLKSDSNGLNKKAYKALKIDEFKNIHYQLISATQTLEDDGYLLKTKGNLTLAGVTKKIDMDMHLLIHKDKTITCKGMYELKMTDYNVKPPSFLFGMMKTGDKTILNFDVTYMIKEPTL